MKRKLMLYTLCLLTYATTFAQTSNNILDKTAALISDKNGIIVSFSLTGEGMTPTNGTISIKGKKFHTEMSSMTVWFDGKTQWTYLKNNNEVNVNNPSDEELQIINPYNCIYLYRNGYNATLTTQAKDYIVVLQAQDKQRKIQEMKIKINRSTSIPSQIEMKQGNRWYTINISNFKKVKLSDNIFQFRAADYPQAEVIDLR